MVFSASGEEAAMITGLKQKLDYDDLTHIPPDRLRYELSEGGLHVTPAPSPRHQWISKQLQRQLETYFEAQGIGRVFNAPIDVILTPEDVFEPDLVVVTNRSQITRRGIEGPPALVVEVLSSSTSAYDRTTKSSRYAALGINHYWIVDEVTLSVECYRRGEAGYEAVARHTGNTTFSHPDFTGLSIDTTPLWIEP
jgi:Uma2 family endonuclease